MTRLPGHWSARVVPAIDDCADDAVPIHDGSPLLVAEPAILRGAFAYDILKNGFKPPPFRQSIAIGFNLRERRRT